jgi:hypothetical protein
MERLYSGLGLMRIFEPPMPVTMAVLPAGSELNLKINPHHRTAIITVKQFGKDFLERLKIKTTELSNKNFNAIYIDLELRDPFTPRAVLMAEDLGFFFSGLLPDYSEGDVLRLQRYTTKVIYDEIHTGSVFGGEFVEYIGSQDKGQKAWHRVQA